MKRYIEKGTECCYNILVKVGANIREANYAQGKKDFISKLEIALKEASEIVIEDIKIRLMNII